MPLFDFFKKKPQRKIEKKLSSSSPELTQALREASNEFFPILKDRFVSTDGTIDVAMILTAAAWLTGTSLFRAFNRQNDLPLGTKINFSKEVHQEINDKWLTLMNQIPAFFSPNRGAPIGIYILEAINIIDAHKPQMELLQIQEEFQDQYNEIMKKHGLDYLDGTTAGMLVCKLLIQEYCSRTQSMQLNLAIGLVAAKCIEATTFMPPPLKPASSKPVEQTSQIRATEKSLEAETPSFSPEMQKKRYEVAMEFLKSFQERLPLVDGKPHPGTVLAVVARLAGTSLYRSLNYTNEIEPGTVVLSNVVDEAWPQLLNLFAYYCRQNGMDVMSKPLVTTFPDQDKPLLTVEQVLEEYQDQYLEIVKKHGLDYLEGARAGMVVASIIFKAHCIQNKDLDPFVATGLVALGVVEGAKTAPPPLGNKPRQGVKKMSRLLLGEPEITRAEAKATGAIYIELAPEALKRLQQANIDPYLIYEESVRKQIEERIARIDFVKADVEQLFAEWRTQPLTQAPIHVRLIFWLKNNAGAYGYEQSGNSWVLKS